MTHLQYFLATTFIFGLVSDLTTAWAAPGDSFAISAVYSLRTDGVCQEITGGSLDGLARKNGHWDAATKTVKLAAARNEEAAVQLVIPRAGKAFAEQMSELRGPGTISANCATFSALLWVKDAD